MGANREAIAAVEFITRHAVNNSRIELGGEIFDTGGLAPACFTMSSSINNVLFCIRDLSARAPERLYLDLSIILGFFETNTIIGWQASQTPRTLQCMQKICDEHIPNNSGVNLAFLLHIHRLLDMLYQTRIAFSLFYHHLDEMQH